MTSPRGAIGRGRGLGADRYGFLGLTGAINRGHRGFTAQQKLSPSLQGVHGCSPRLPVKKCKCDDDHATTSDRSQQSPQPDCATGPGGGPMIGLAKLSIRRPKLSLALWSLIAIVLTLIGFGVSSTLSPSITVVPGTQSSRAQQLANAQFGPSQLVPIMLEGPAAQLNRQGPSLVRALSKRPHTRVLSAWDAGTASAGLRPKPTAAMMVVSIDRSEKNAVQYDEPQIESLVSRQISAPVKAFITGQPSIDRALKSASISNLRKTELIALGILFLLRPAGRSRSHPGARSRPELRASPSRVIVCAGPVETSLTVRYRSEEHTSELQSLR